jgi:hypothetical protein
MERKWLRKARFGKGVRYLLGCVTATATATAKAREDYWFRCRGDLILA